MYLTVIICIPILLQANGCVAGPLNVIGLILYSLFLFNDHCYFYLNYGCVFSGGCDSRPKEIANGMAIYRGLKFGDRVRYICNAGHKLIGDKYLTCEGGEWKGRLPECKAGENLGYFCFDWICFLYLESKK